MSSEGNICSTVWSLHVPTTLWPSFFFIFSLWCVYLLGVFLAAAPASVVRYEVGAGSDWRWWTVRVCADSACWRQLVCSCFTALLTALKHYTHLRKLKYILMLSRKPPEGPVTSAIKGVHSIYLRLYSSLSLFTLASTLYRALISGVMVSIWTPTPSGCTQDTPGLVRRSAPGPNLRVWL